MAKRQRTPPTAHPAHGRVVFRATLVDDQNRRYELTYTVDATKLPGELNAMLLAGVGERKLPGTPFTARCRRLGDEKEEVPEWQAPI